MFYYHQALRLSVVLRHSNIRRMYPFLLILGFDLLGCKKSKIVRNNENIMNSIFLLNAAFKKSSLLYFYELGRPSDASESSSLSYTL